MLRSLLSFVLIALGTVAVADDASRAPKLTSVPLATAQTKYSRAVVSFQELRQSKLVRQTWDSSCGAAALSTLLTYHVGISVSEYAVAAMILRGSDPNRVRQRGGFSLLDLKRFVEAIGLVGEGYGSMSVADLEGKSAPAIIPIHLRNLDHFVVFRGRIGDRVLLGDPAFGNLTVPVKEFEAIWRSHIAFYVSRGADQASKAPSLDVTEMDVAIPDLSQVGRLLRTAAATPATRQLPLIARKK